MAAQAAIVLREKRKRWLSDWIINTCALKKIYYATKSNDFGLLPLPKDFFLNVDKIASLM